MKKQKKILVDIEIDKLTNSIENAVSGDVFGKDSKQIIKMGSIREPKNVDFTVLDKPWTDEERKEFSAFIKLRKEQRKKRTAKPAPSKRGTTTPRKKF
ncbi:MAG: hypothetical protein KF845_06430 [Cyclobacteriaceae bacterium]|nr:hypothetical protein [Cyclobacteriaceae bacterium]